MRSRLRRPLCLTALTAIALASQPSNSSADETALHPNLARGRGSVSPHSFDGLGPDRVDLFTGNLNIELPIGIEYPIGGDLSYRFALSYNSSIWDLGRDSSGSQRAVPLATSNAGIGWSLSFGRLLAPEASGNPSSQWVYVSPDGGLHPFYSTLHPGLGENDPEDTTRYSRDGTYLRLVTTAGGALAVQQPDGLERRFELVGGELRLTRISNRYGAALDVAYPPDGSWTVTDSHGRTHRVLFRDDPTGAYPDLVDSLELAGFDGTTVRYRLAYTFREIERSCLDSSDETPATASVPLLATITLPDGTRYTLEHGDSACAAGRLASLTLPFGGTLGWEYGPYSFAEPQTPGLLPPYLTELTGVTRRSTTDADGSLLGSWEISRWRVDVGEGEQVAAATAVTRVTDPLGHKERRYFSVYAQPESRDGLRASDYGLPIDRRAPVGNPALYLAQSIFDCGGNGGSCSTVREVASDWDQDAACTPADASCAAVNRRARARRVLYLDDPDGAGGVHFVDVERRRFDGLGHYREVVTSGSFGGPPRTVVTAFDAATGDYPGTGYSMPAPGDPWVLETYSQRAVAVGLNGSGPSSQVERLVRDFCFDPGTGQLLRRRDRRGDLPGPADVVVELVADGFGTVSEQRYFGGDVQPIPAAADLCALELPPAPYRLRRRTHRFGALESERWIDVATGSPLPYARRIIDRNTGLAKVERDEAGLETALSYDALGRLTERHPPAGQGPRLEVVYLPAAAGESARITTRFISQNDSEVLRAEERRFDAFGRPVEERRLMPGQRWSLRELGYDAAGNQDRAAVPRFEDETAAFAQRLDYDPFGRPRSEQAPDGTVIELSYRGERLQVESWSEAAYDLGDTFPPDDRVLFAPSERTLLLDRDHRPVEERQRYTEPSGQERTDVEAFSYDAAGHLLEARRNGERVGYRKSYDGRGFLLSQIAPDSDLPAVTLGDHDPLGNATTRQVADHEIAYVYDPAGRLVETRDAGNGGRVLQRFIYATRNLPGRGWTRGRLVETQRTHYRDQYSTGFFFTGTATVTQRTDLTGPAGRPSRQTVTIADDEAVRYEVEQHWRWNELGEVSEVTYPQSTVAPPGLGPLPGRTVSYSYEAGWLSAVGGSYTGPNPSQLPPSWIEAVDYGAGGRRRSTVHANGVRTVTRLDAAGRTSEIDLLDGFDGQTWHSGLHRYDAGGTLYQIGERLRVPERDLTPEPPPEVPEGPFCPLVLDPFGLALSFGGGDCGDAYYLANFYDASGRRVLTLGGPPADYSGELVTYGPFDQELRGLDFSWNGFQQPASLLSVADHVQHGSEEIGSAALDVARGALGIRHLHGPTAPASNGRGRLELETASSQPAGAAEAVAIAAARIAPNPATQPGIFDEISELPPNTQCLKEITESSGCEYFNPLMLQEPSCDQMDICHARCLRCCSKIPGATPDELLAFELRTLCIGVITIGTSRLIPLIGHPEIRRIVEKNGILAIIALCDLFRRGLIPEARSCDEECRVKAYPLPTCDEEMEPEEMEPEEMEPEEPRPMGPRELDLPRKVRGPYWEKTPIPLSGGQCICLGDIARLPEGKALCLGVWLCP